MLQRLITDLSGDIDLKLDKFESNSMIGACSKEGWTSFCDTHCGAKDKKYSDAVTSQTQVSHGQVTGSSKVQSNTIRPTKAHLRLVLSTTPSLPYLACRVFFPHTPFNVHARSHCS